MASWKILLLLAALLPLIFAAPLDPKKQRESGEEEEQEKDDETDDIREQEEDYDTGLEYDRYLQEVINVLEKDPDFKKKLEEADIEHIKSGRIADELNLVDHQVRSKLDELKRHEINRLRLVAREQLDQKNGVKRMDKKSITDLLGHVDLGNTKSFEEEDLAKLIQKATKDLDEMDRRRKTDFKKYEMEKEIKRREKLKQMSDAKREQAKQEWEESQKKRKQHDKVKHPGSKKQLEEVWEETDHLDKDDFDPRTFFMLHDKNGDGKLDPMELEALFVNEIEKIYGDDSDPREKMEEMSRMREHVMKEIDTDKDFMVSMREFMDATRDKDFDNEESWEDLGDKDLFTEEELADFQRQLQEMEARRMRNNVKKQQQQQLGGEDDKLKFQAEAVAQVAAQQAAQQKSAQELAQQQKDAQLRNAQEAARQNQQAAQQQTEQKEQMKQQFDEAHAAIQQQHHQQQQQQQQHHQQQQQFDEAHKAIKQQHHQNDANVVVMEGGQPLQAQAAQAAQVNENKPQQ
ncbi:nucleobindin-2-like [Saccoglossus kowalevskii]|uniref:Nucleobindin-2-like n=1 Tax=Saccoglossus kowalevskii TaxID=10224 RepID=A0ABM0GJ19_SACKO|nr:PREDICTED: nucleobindin-2-like [Saccoglossus kowalevskii]